MKNKITLTIISILFLNSMTIQAQDEEITEPSKWNIGLGAGINISNYFLIATNDYIDPFHNNVGLDVYGLASFKLSNRLKLKVKPGFTILRNTLGISKQIKTSLIELPIILDIKIYKGLSIEAGWTKLYIENISYTHIDRPNFINSWSDKPLSSLHFALNYERNNKWGINFKTRFINNEIMNVVVYTYGDYEEYVRSVSVYSFSLSTYFNIN